MIINEILKIENVTEKIIALQEFCSQQKNPTKTEKLILFVEDFENDVMNGGFQQYFENKSEEEQNEVLVNLDEIGAKKSKVLLEKALKIFNESKDSSFDKIDSEFFKYEDNIQNLVIKYAEENIKDFNK